MSELIGNETIEEIEKELEPVFESISINSEDLIISKVPDKCKIILSRNIVFLRHYIGFEQFLKPYNQEDFAKLLNVSLPTLKKWEGANNLPSRFSLKAILQFANNILFGKEVIRIEHILCKNLVDIIKTAQTSIIMENNHQSSNSTQEKIAMIKEFEDLILKTLNVMKDACLIVQDSRIVFANNTAIQLFSGNDLHAPNFTMPDLLLPNIDLSINSRANGNNNGNSHSKKELFFEKTLRKSNGVLFNAMIAKSYTFFDTKPAVQYVIKQN